MSFREYTEDEVQDLTDRVFLLNARLEAGDMQFASQELADSFRRSCKKIRLRPDGKVDPLSLQQVPYQKSWNDRIRRGARVLNRQIQGS